MIVVCPKCGAKNRVPDPQEPGRKYLCGKCNTRLPLAPQAPVAQAPSSLVEGRPVSQHITLEAKRDARAVGIVLKKLAIVHPLLWAIIPILYLYNVNVVLVAPSEIAIPVAGALSLMAVLFLPTWLIIRDLNKVAIIISIFLILFFFYGYALDVIGGWDADQRALRPIIWVILSIIWAIIFISSTYFIVKTRRDLHNITIIMVSMPLVLTILFTASIILYETKVPSSNIRTTGNMTMNTDGSGTTNTYPDIYYIVLDRYASANTLEAVYDFDNCEFIDYLSDKGFYVASEARANGLFSAMSLASSLNMEHINDLTQELGEELLDIGPLYAIMQDHKLWHFLKSKGYQYIHLGPPWEATRINKHADVNLGYVGVREFSMRVFELTMAYPFCVKLGVFEDWRTLNRECVLYNFDKLAEVATVKEHTFVFAHFYVPHTPYVFDRDGGYPTVDEVNKRSERDNYVNQLVFTNGKVRELIDELLSSSEPSPIIILQADEGPFPEGTHGHFNWEEATEAQFREKFGILNAYYLPNVDQDVLYSSITPVNSFRVVFNLYFDTDFKLLPDRSYAFDSGHIYKFFDVTDKAKYD